MWKKTFVELIEVVAQQVCVLELVKGVETFYFSRRAAVGIYQNCVHSTQICMFAGPRRLPHYNSVQLDVAISFLTQAVCAVRHDLHFTQC